jgi:hypothetical protein
VPEALASVHGEAVVVTMKQQRFAKATATHLDRAIQPLTNSTKLLVVTGNESVWLFPIATYFK